MLFDHKIANADREAISRFVYKLQNQDIVPVWTLAHQGMIYAIAIGKPTAWGANALRLRSLLAVVDKLRLADLVLLLVGVGVATKLWLKVRKDAWCSRETRCIDRVFVGFGANAEEKMWEHYCDKLDVLPLRINQTNGEGMSSLGCPSLFSIYWVLVRETLGYSARLKQLIDVPGQGRLDFLTSCGMSAGIYAFYREYWEMVKDSAVTEVVFLAADIPAFACVDAGVAAIYFQHGLISLSSLMPKFNRIEVLTADEKEYLVRMHCSIDVVRVACDNGVTREKKNAMLLLSVDDKPPRLATSMRLVAWAEHVGVSVIVRPVPSLSEGALVRLKDMLPSVHFDMDGLGMDESIARYNPKFIVGWTSTALATSLSYGCIPVSLCDPEEHDGIKNMIYPMQHRVLFWPRDEQVMKMAIWSDQVLLDYVKRFREYRDSAFDWM